MKRSEMILGISKILGIALSTIAFSLLLIHLLGHTWKFYIGHMIILVLAMTYYFILMKFFSGFEVILKKNYKEKKSE